jgi:hypothetical protein
MRLTACTLLVALLPCLSVCADDAAGTTDTQIAGAREQMFRDVGRRHSVLMGVEVFVGKSSDNDVIQGVRPIFLDAQGRQQPGSLHGKDNGRPAVSVKAKKGYVVGAISVKTGQRINGLSVTFMKVEKGRLNPEKSYESEWLGGQDGGDARSLGGSGEAVVGLLGSQNQNSELNGLGLVLSSKPIATTPQKKLPVPDQGAQAKSHALAKEVYGGDWAAAKSFGQKKELAQKLLKGADESENDPAGRYVLLQLARDIGTQVTDGGLAFTAIDKMAEDYQVDDVEMKLAVLTAFSKRTKLQGDHKALAEQAVGMVDATIAHDKIDLAVKLCELALPEARAAHDQDLLHEVNARTEQCKALARAYREMLEAAAVLDARPDDAQANLTVGKYYCLQKGDWEKGLPMLALGQDEALKAVAGQEIASVVKSADRVKVGDAWWDLADKAQGAAQATLRNRAAYWYQQALSEQSGLAKARLEKRIRDAESGVVGTADKKTEGVVPKRPGRYLPGLVAQYYNDLNLVQRAKARLDAKLDFDWGNDSPDPLVHAENFGSIWLGYIKAPKTGHYVIHARSQHDSQVLIDNAVVITNQLKTAHACDQQAEINLMAGYHVLLVRFVHGSGPAYAHLGWQPPGETNWVAIPAQNLFHDQRQEQTAGISAGR